MMHVFEFDARRKKNGTVSARELRIYSMNLAHAYTRFLVHFVEPRYQHSKNDVLLAHACHRAHMIRDLMIDYDLGYINIAQEDLDAFALKPGYLKGAVLSRWLEHEVRGIKELMEQGKQALHACRLLRIKIMGLLYCFRYEAILHRIESARYSLQEKYQVRIIDYIRLCGQCLITCVEHLFQCVRI
jgi:phytoene/squalene synthetase